MGERKGRGGNKVVPIGKRGLSRRHCTADSVSSLEGTCIQTGNNPASQRGGLDFTQAEAYTLLNGAWPVLSLPLSKHAMYVLTEC